MYRKEVSGKNKTWKDTIIAWTTLIFFILLMIPVSIAAIYIDITRAIRRWAKKE